MDDNEGFRLRDVGASLWRRRWIVIAFTVLGAVLAGGYYMTATKSYQGEAQVVAQPITGDQFAGNARPQDLLNMITERNLMLSSNVATEVGKRIGSDAVPDDLIGRVEVENPEGSFTLNIGFKATDPETAAKGANEFAKVYLERRQQQAQETIDRSVTDITEQLTAAQTELQQALQAEAAAPIGSSARAEATADAETVKARISSLEQRRSDLLAVDTTPGVVTRTASTPQGPAGTPKWINAMGIFLFITLIGVVVALALDLLDPYVRGGEELARLVPLASVQLLPSPRDPAAAAGRAEGMARLAVRIGGAIGGGTTTVQLVALSSTAPGRAATELVDTFKGAGRRTLVVWTGPIATCPAPDDRLSGSLGPVLRGQISVEDATEFSNEAEEWIAPSVVSELSALLRPNTAQTLIKSAEEADFDIVIFCTPSPQHQAAALGVARNVDAVVLVSEDARVQRRALRTTVDLLGEERVQATEILVG